MNWEEIKGINSYALWISAFGTWFAAWTALRLARKDNKLRLAVDVEFGLKYPRKDIPPSVVIRATNISRRPVNITGIFWEAMSFSWHDHPIKPGENTEYENISNSFPALLKEGEHAEIFLSPSEFLSDLIDPRVGPYSGFFAVKTLKVKVETANSIFFTSKLGRPIRRYIFNKYFLEKTKLKWLMHLV